MKDTILQNRIDGFRAGGIVIDNNKMLLMHQTLEVPGSKEFKDFYTIPGGSWKKGETLEQTCKREIMEEFCLNVDVGKLLFLIDTKTRIAFYFLCTCNTDNVELGEGPEKERMYENETYKPEWIELKKVTSLNIIPQAITKALKQYFDSPSQPTFFIKD